MAILQVRNMADDLYAALGRRAAMDSRSISQEVIAIVKRYLATPTDAASSDEQALQLAGSWNDARTAEEIAEDVRQSRSTRRVLEGF